MDLSYYKLTNVSKFLLINKLTYTKLPAFTATYSQLLQDTPATPASPHQPKLLPATPSYPIYPSKLNYGS